MMDSTAQRNSTGFEEPPQREHTLTGVPFFRVCTLTLTVNGFIKREHQPQLFVSSVSTLLILTEKSLSSRTSNISVYC